MFSQTVWLSARDLRTHSNLKAEVKVAKIHRIEIFSRFGQINRGDSQSLEVKAFDDEGRAFTTLEGFKFDWTVVSGGDNIRRIKPREAGHSKEHRKHGHEISEEGSKNDDDFYCRGLQAGVTTIKVKILENGYEQVPPAFVNFTIVEPFTIMPDPSVFPSVVSIPSSESIYILPTSDFQYRLSLIEMGEDLSLIYSDQKLPSPKYAWSLSNSSKHLGQIGQDGLFRSLVKPGQATIQVVEKVFEKNTAEAVINVVEPFYLEIELCDVTEAYERNANLSNSKEFVSSFASQLNATRFSSNWIMVESKTYLVKVLLYDKERNRILMTSNLEFAHAYDSKFFSVLAQNLVASELIVKVAAHSSEEPTPAHKTIFTSTLKQIKTTQKDKYKVDSTRLRDEKEVTITSPVKIIHPTPSILLPVLKSIDGTIPGEMWQLTAKGGSGHYVWASDDSVVARISERSRVWSVNEGSTYLKVRDLHNENNYASILVEVAPVHHLTWLESRLEAHRQTETSLLSVIALDSRGRKFTNCTALEMRFDIKGDGASLLDRQAASDWTALQSYVHSASTLPLIRLRSRFDQEISKVFESELKPDKNLTEKDLILHRYNNFGICDQVRVKAKDQGLSRVRAYFDTYDRTIESEKAEVGSYEFLSTTNPDYPSFLSDLYSKS